MRKGIVELLLDDVYVNKEFSLEISRVLLEQTKIARLTGAAGSGNLEKDWLTDTSIPLLLNMLELLALKVRMTFLLSSLHAWHAIFIHKCSFMVAFSFLGQFFFFMAA